MNAIDRDNMLIKRREHLSQSAITHNDLKNKNDREIQIWLILKANFYANFKTP